MIKLKILKFLSVGALATIVHVFFYILSLEILNVSAQYANAIGFGVSFLVSYLGQRWWTFKDSIITNEAVAKFKFILSSLISFCLNALWVFITERVLKIEPTFSVIGIIAITPLVTFLILQLWVFKSHDK